MPSNGPESMGAPEQLLDLCPGVLFTQRENFSFEYITPGIEKWSGVTAAEWLRQPDLLERLIVGADAAAVRRQRSEALAAPGPTHLSFRIRHRQTGRITYVAETRRAVRTSAGTVARFEGAWVDVSLTALAGRKLESAGWDAAFGLATLGATHDLNNKLTAILSLSDLYLTEIDKTHPLREGLATIKQSAQQASQVLHQLASLHQAAPGQPEYVDLNAFITTAADLLRRVMPSRIMVETAARKEPVTVMVDRVRLQRLIVTWALCAVERMPKRGTFRLETDRVSGEGASRGALRIQDTGRPVSGKSEHAAAHAAYEAADLAALDQMAKFAEGCGGKFEWRSEATGTSLDIVLPQEGAPRRTAKTSTPWILMLAQEAEALAELAEQLEARGATPVVARNSGAEQLDSNWFLWDAVIVHAPAETVAGMFEPVQRRKLEAKLIIDLRRGDVSDLDPWTATSAELILPADLPSPVRAEKIMKSMM